MTTLRCVVERITYQNSENGYSVLKVKVKGYDDLVTLVGNLLEVPVGVSCCAGASGKWTSVTAASSLPQRGRRRCPLRFTASRNTSAADW